MPRSDLEVFDYVQQSDDPLHIDYLTYAVFAHDKREWIKHREAQTGQTPDQDAINAWIANMADSQFERMRGAAVDVFDEAARDYLAADLEEARESVLRSAIVAEVRAASSFWKQNGYGVGNGHSRSVDPRGHYRPSFGLRELVPDGQGHLEHSAAIDCTANGTPRWSEVMPTGRDNLAKNSNHSAAVHSNWIRKPG